MTGRAISVALHVGAHKTATTHLQLTIARNRALLDAAGVRALLPGQLRGPGQSVAARFGLDDAAPVAGGGYGALGRLLPDPADRLLISEENFTGSFRGPRHRLHLPLYPKAAARIEGLVAAVAPAPVDVYLAVREPCNFLRGCYSQTLLGGAPVSPALFFLDRGPEVVDWVGLVARIRAVPGLRRLGVWAYEDYPANVTQIFRRMARWRVGKMIVPPVERTHASLSQQAVLTILEADPDLPPHAVARAARAAFPVGPDWPGFDPFPPEVRETAQAHYADQLARIAALQGVDLLDLNDLRPALR